MAKLNTKIVMLKGEQGKDGTNIKSVEKSASDVLTDTYTITLTDGSKSSFNVTNGKGISNISKTGAIGLDDIYTITYNDETTSNFTVPNGKGTDLIQEQIVPTASIERGETASKAYSAGDYLVKNGALYKVTTDIAQGDALTVGENIVMTTVGSELSSIKSNSTDKWTFKKLTGTDNNVTVPSGVKEFYLGGVNSYNNLINSITIPIELFNYDEILKFYSFVDANANVHITRTSTENVYSVHNVGLSFAIFGYR